MLWCQSLMALEAGMGHQCVQPLPITGTLSSQERATNSFALAPTGIPLETHSVAVQRHKRRRRSLTEQSSPHTRIVPPVPDLVVDGSLEYEMRDYMPNIADFMLTSTESTAMYKLQLDIYFAMLLKNCNQKKGDRAISLPAIPSFIHCLHKQSMESESSNVLYVDVISEKANHKSTLLNIIGRLHKTFVTELNQKWVVFIGDAKVFDILQDIRSDYGENLKWLVPIPGDWHTLYNFQKALMKPYWDAGLINLAKVTGYRLHHSEDVATSEGHIYLFYSALKHSTGTFYSCFLPIVLVDYSLSLLICWMSLH